MLSVGLNLSGVKMTQFDIQIDNFFGISNVNINPKPNIDDHFCQPTPSFDKHPRRRPEEIFKFRRVFIDQILLAQTTADCLIQQFILLSFFLSLFR